MNHKILKVVTAPGVPVDVDGEVFIPAITDTVNALGRPDANSYLLLEVELSNGGTLYGLCKPRGFRPARNGEPELVGWAVAVIHDTQFTALEDVDPDEIDGRLMGFLGLEGDDAYYWTRRV